MGSNRNLNNAQMKSRVSNDGGEDDEQESSDEDPLHEEPPE